MLEHRCRGGAQSHSTSACAGIPDLEEGSALNWPPSEAALAHADEGLRALLEGHQRQLAAAAEAAAAGRPLEQLGSRRKRNLWEPSELKKRQQEQTQHNAMAEPIFARVLDADEVRSPHRLRVVRGHHQAHMQKLVTLERDVQRLVTVCRWLTSSLQRAQQTSASLMSDPSATTPSFWCWQLFKLRGKRVQQQELFCMSSSNAAER